MPGFDFSKKIVSRKVRETKRILAEVVPSPFFIERELKDFSIVESEAARVRVIQSFYERRGYAQISNELLDYITYYSKSFITAKLITFIATKLKFNSNKIILKPSNEDIKRICLNETNFARHINELESQNIIRRTTEQSVYVVNHEMIFKGSYSDFIKVYLDTYKEVGIMLDEKGRVVLDKHINYGK